MIDETVMATGGGQNSDSKANPRSTIFSAQEQDIATALLAVGGVADRAMVCRAQRLVREQAIELADRRRRVRHGIGITILGFSLLFLVLTPVFWSGMQMLLDPKNFPASELQFVYVIAWLFPVTLVTLFLVFLRTRSGGGTRRIDHHITSRLDSMVR